MDFKERIINSTVEMLQKTRCGFMTSQHLSSVVDEIISNEFERFATDELSLVAVGGYGRRELAPFSDIDLMILCKNKSQSVSNTVEKILYSLWDMGIGISHSVRTVQETIQDATDDIQTRTSLLDSRFICGSVELWNEYKRDAFEKIVRRKRGDFVASLLSEVSRRYKNYSLSLYQLEPNIKEGRGGLRDMHTIQWLMRISFGFEKLEDLKRFFSSVDYRQFKRACEFILRTRICLHIESKVKNELLSFQYQEKVAKMMGFKNTQRFLSSEIFLRIYYRHTRTIMDILNRISRLCVKRVMNVFNYFFKKPITNNYILFSNEIVIKDSSLLDNPDVIMEAFLAYAISKRSFSINLESEIKRAARKIKKSKQVSLVMSKTFMKILDSSRVYETLYEMHRLAILEIVIPEFRRLRYLVVHEPYHRYTVDEHTLRTIKHLEGIKSGINMKHKILYDITKELDIKPIYIALLLHDIGKGIYGSRLRHEGEGYKIIKGIIEIFELDRQSKCLIEFLVMHHLVLSRDALKRDIDDPNTILWLTDIVQDEIRLKSLMLITFADMSAVRTDFFGEWKAQILYELYSKTLAYIRGIDEISVYPESEQIQGFLSLMPERYRLSTALEDVKMDFMLLNTAIKKGVSVEIRHHTTDVVEVVISTKDSKGLFLKIVDVISRFGLNIVKARLYPLKNSMIIDKIYVSNYHYVSWEGFEETFISELCEKILSDSDSLQLKTDFIDLSKLAYASSFKQRHFINFEPFVELDNDISENYTMIELFAGDRIGLLYDISKIFVAYGIDIVSAIINTEGDIAHDVFYVQHNRGKVSNIISLRILISIYYVVGLGLKGR